MLNAIGLQNIGVEAFLRDRLPALGRAGARVVANFWGDSPEEFAECAARLDGAPGVVALELNASSPNPPVGGRIHATDPQAPGHILPAVQVGTATFYDPRAPLRIAGEMARWCRAHGIRAVGELIGTLRT